MELKKCPFCGGNVDFYEGSHIFKCEKCGVIVRFPIKDEYLQEIAADGLVLSSPQFYKDAQEQRNSRYKE